MQILKYLMRTKNGLVSVKPEAMKDFVKAQQAMKNGSLPRKTLEEVRAMKKQVLLRTTDQKQQ